MWLAVVLLACATPVAWTTYGTEPTLAAARPAKEVLSDPQQFVGSTVRVEGTVSDVCTMAGCWLVLADDDGHALRVRMKDHAFSVPKDCRGQTADVEGTVVDVPTDPEAVAHYESEGGSAPEKGSDHHVELVASGVRLWADR